MKDYPSRKEPFVSDNTSVDIEREWMDESQSVFTADNRRDYSASVVPRNKKRASLLPLLLMACVCLGGVLWLASRAGRDAPQRVPLQPLAIPLPLVNADDDQAPPVLSQTIATPAPVVDQPSDDHSPTLVAKEPVVDPELVAPKSAESKKKSANHVVKSGSVNWKATPGNYTVQLVAAFSKQGVERIKAQLPATTPSVIHKTTKDGKPWFILVYGSFGSKQEALHAQARLPDSVSKDVKPWVRKQGEVFAQ